MTCNSEHLSISIQTILSNRFGEDDDLLLVNKELVYMFLYIRFLFVVFIPCNFPPILRIGLGKCSYMLLLLRVYIYIYIYK